MIVCHRGAVLGTLLAVSVVVVGGCGAAPDATGAPPGTGVDQAQSGEVAVSGPYEWTRVRTTDNERIIAIDFTGGAEYDASDICSVQYKASVVETTHDVRVTVSGWSPPPTSTTMLWGCRALGYPRSVLVTLEAPLGNRPVINTATNAAHAVNVEPWSPPTTTISAAGTSGTFEGQLVAASNEALPNSVRPIAGAVTFEASDGTKYSVDADNSGMFSALLPLGEYTVTGRGTLPDSSATACQVSVGPVFVRGSGPNGSVQLVCKP